jgi:hypothetical protein
LPNSWAVVGKIWSRVVVGKTALPSSLVPLPLALPVSLRPRRILLA